MRSFRWLLLIPLLGCSLPEPVPPSAEFLLADGSSTYWVRSGPDGISARMSPLILTKADNRFYEVFVGEVVRSYEDAVFSREPIYRRDLLRGERRLVYEDDRIAEWERRYLANHPEARLLDPDDEEAADPTFVASAEADILAVAGPYVLYDGRHGRARGFPEIRFIRRRGRHPIGRNGSARYDGARHRVARRRWRERRRERDVAACGV
ncbi:MAG: hypothetical protein H0T48_14455 [Gemmatimonadaceae bacterium]|nr:hypothetical protein [Gemmatimonadaceae bacterium]